MTERQNPCLLLKSDEITISGHKAAVDTAIERAWSWLNDPKIKDKVCADTFPADVDRYREIFHTFPCFAIFIESKIQGMIWLPGDNFYIITARDTWRQGHAKKAARMFLHFVMNATPAVRIASILPTTNVMGKLFLEHVGFKREGTIRKAVAFGGLRDAWIMGLIAEDTASWDADMTEAPEVEPEATDEPIEEPEEDIATEVVTEEEQDGARSFAE